MKQTLLGLLPIIVAGCLFMSGNNQSPDHTSQVDGPYVHYSNDTIAVRYVVDDHGTKKLQEQFFTSAQKSSIQLTVATDEPGKIFNVQLKTTLQNEQVEHGDVSKMLIISDIEGNFKAFRKLLQVNGVIDDQINWTFGGGHLVLTGDFFDRGDQQTEVLWLIYSLEEKAKAAGGYVHFVLGNHEIMNLSGDLRYVNTKYTSSTSLLKMNYNMFYGEQSELGRWLRTKNIMEKIGDILFIHGGISPAVNRMALPAQNVNTMARPYYPDSIYKYTDPRIDTLFSDLGPFWYRGYYSGSRKATAAQVDSTLALYGVKHISTGHTVIADTISILFNGKVFNTDVHHAKGLSEALLIEDGKYYRVKSSGEKIQVL